MNPNYITPLDTPHRGWRYGSDLAVYTERLVNGRLLAASYVHDGIPLRPTAEHTDTPAFDLVIDGQSAAFGWELVAWEQWTESADVACGRLQLRHTTLPVALAVTTRAAGHGFFRRSLALTNLSTGRPLGLTALTPWRATVWDMRDNLSDHLLDRSQSPFSVGRFVDAHWGNEGHFAWQDVPLNTELAWGSRTGRSGHGNPFFVARNNLWGGYLLAHLGWSANWQARLLCDYTDHQPRVCLRCELSPQGIPPLRMIAPGETLHAPDVHVGFCHTDLDTAIQNSHAYLRATVLRPVPRAGQPVIYNHWSYTEHELSEEALGREIDVAADVGAELFIVDAGWYADRGTPWWDTTGDWQAGDRLPRDLFPVFEHARRRGLACGLWAEIESAAPLSRLARAHPDWFIQRYGESVPRILDLAKPDVAAHVEAEIIRLVERYELDLFRLDYNVQPLEGGFNTRDGVAENSLWRQTEAIHAIFDRLAHRFPRLQLENCSSGGGRTDLAMVSRFTTTWVSDWMRPPRTVRILNGLSLVLPPEYINRLAGMSMDGSARASLDLLMHQAILAHPTLSGLTPALAQSNPTTLACVRRYIALYKRFIRPFQHEALVYHHTPVLTGADGNGWCALELAAPDRSRVAAGVFRLTGAPGEEYRLRLRGLDGGGRYRVTGEPDGGTWTATGHALADDGLAVRLPTPLTSRLFLVERA